MTQRFLQRAVVFVCLMFSPLPCAHAVEHASVVIYGGTPAGIAAALAAGRSGDDVLLVEPYRRIGGLTTNGLSHTDFRTFEGLSGTYLELTRRVQTYYRDKYGEDSPQAQGNFRGTHAEPHVNQLLFEQMLSEAGNIRVLTRHRLVDVTVADESPRQVTEVIFEDADGKRVSVHGLIWIDATYEGDLMAAAGIEYRVGREARAEYGESLAPETADEQVQGYNFRPIMTQEPDNLVRPDAPEGYRREDYLPVIPLLEAGRFDSIFCRQTGGIYKAHRPTLPNGKYDVNDVSRGLVRLSLPDINNAWPDGDAAVRREIFAEHVRHNVGLLHFLQNDPAVPKKYQEESRTWGFCRDEFANTDHLPEQLYIREARRMVGQYIFTEKDTDVADGDSRTVLRTDAIAMGDYGPNCHGTDHDGPRFGGRHTGEFYKRVPPYQIRYGTIVPKECGNLLVPVACSASHVGFCALRLEPIWTSLGQAAGHAAHLALATQQPVQKVPIAELQRELHADGSSTIYVSDVLPGDDDYEAVQWWGTLGGLHGLHGPQARPGERGRNITGQYYEAFPGHAAELDEPLDDQLKQRWLKLAEENGLSTKPLAMAKTRGEFIRQAYAMLDRP
ncbi:FAD dependent oxidoreductase [Maioricimonas rarisocia]|uniref:FAD dependent oxidoreductase n=1 Tax=Maioricimonas rarisocia TaxID=2528026 RepID=A0A517YZS3_9PLAN|nr:FAD-dependent oxidoreductase [Maioricimonas rarisocia]QDU35734.1 FAD dependent oxidoreductase [Maioricimonas rarisocia]